MKSEETLYKMMYYKNSKKKCIDKDDVELIKFQ